MIRLFAVTLASVCVITFSSSAIAEEKSQTSLNNTEATDSARFPKSMSMMAQAHGLQNLQADQTVSGQLLATAGERTLIEGKLMTKANMSEICYDLKDAGELVVNGDGTFLSPASVEMPKAHFMSKTFPYFILAPYKFMTDEGIHVIDTGTQTLDGSSFDTAKITFGDGVGDSPEDYYVLYINQDNHQLHAIQFVATYSSSDASKATPYLLKYDEYAIINGTDIPTKMSEYLFNQDGTSGKKIVDVTFENPAIGIVDPAVYKTPEDSKELFKG